MLNLRSMTLMMFDHDRFFVGGILHYLQTRYPHLIIRFTSRQVKKVDLLLTGMDPVSLCAAKHYAPIMTDDSQLLLVRDPDEEACRSLPAGLQCQSTWHLHRRQSLAHLGRLFDNLIPDRNRLITVIDPRSFRDDVLTPREKMLVEHLRGHLTPIQIAGIMHLHPKTISTYKRSVMLKLGMQKNLELYHWLFYS